jgi:hypothetical protein
MLEHLNNARFPTTRRRAVHEASVRPSQDDGSLRVVSVSHS